jgi:hypothetical protein
MQDHVRHTDSIKIKRCRILQGGKNMGYSYRNVHEELTVSRAMKLLRLFTIAEGG